MNKLITLIIQGLDTAVHIKLVRRGINSNQELVKHGLFFFFRFLFPTSPLQKEHFLRRK